MNKTEIYKQIIGFDKYEFSTYGNIKNIKTQKQLKVKCVVLHAPTTRKAVQ